MVVQIRRVLSWGVLSTAVIIGIAGCASRPKYTKEALARMDTEIAYGIVTKQGNGRFFMEEKWSGKTHLFQTGARTQFIPEDYRSQVGDKVRVVYTKVLRRNYKREGSPFMRKVIQVHSITVAPQNKLPQMPMVGKVIWIGRGSRSLYSSASFVLELDDGRKSFTIYLPASMERRMPGGSAILLDRRVSIHIKRIPNLKYNCYHYIVEKLTIVNEDAITQASY